MKKASLLLAATVTASSNLVQASDDYVDFGYAGHTSKFYNQTYHVKASKELMEGLIATAEYNTSYADWSDPGEHEELTTHTVLIDLYKTFQLHENIQTYVGLGYNNSSAKFNCISGCLNSSYTNQKPDGSAVEGTVGIRYQVENGLSISGQFTKINDIEGTYWSNTDSSYELDISYPVLESVSVGLRNRNYDGAGSDIDFTSAYLRYQY